MNFGRYQDPTIDRLLAAGRAEPDVAKRKTIYEDLNRRFAQQAHNVVDVERMGGVVTTQGARHPRPGHRWRAAV
nr:hypothetical protein [Candidatus Microthrix sp.]